MRWGKYWLFVALPLVTAIVSTPQASFAGMLIAKAENEGSISKDTIGSLPVAAVAATAPSEPEKSDPPATNSNLQALMDKVQKLELENQKLKEDLTAVKDDIVELRKRPEAAAGTGQTGDKPPLVALTGASIEMYGYIKTDMIYGTRQIGELTMSAPVLTNNEPQFIVTAKETRFGFNILGPKLGEDGKTVGKIEADFWGNTTDASSTPALRLRQAYVDLKFPKWDFLAGQTWDFFAPYNPSTLNLAILWRAGNIGDRHPQVRWSATTEALGGKLTQQLGIVDSRMTEQWNAGVPLGASYTSLETKIFEKDLTLGVGGIGGESCISTTTRDTRRILAGIFTAKLKWSDKISFMGEAFKGENLAAFRAGSPVGIDHTKAVRSQGGWGQITLKPIKRLQFNTGAGIDDVTTDSVTTGTNAVWQDNFSYFFNTKYELVKDLLVGLEFQHFQTRYAEQDDMRANRIQSSIIYNF
nr:conserved hypothetical protein [uncultured bacterium]